MCAKKAVGDRARADDPQPDDKWVARIREGLLGWHGDAGRDLPWRGEHDPYRVLVSELMLVQTTVAAVKPYYARFLDRFPTVQALAEAEEAQVLKVWEGLGYYRRARQLHAAAQAIVREHGGIFPRDPDAILALPGVGRYIAGAIRSFAFGEAAPIVEANTQRVIARWLAWGEDLKSTRSQNVLWRLAERLVPEANPGAFNQAFMDLGATICLPRSPLCLLCPVSGYCNARELGQQDVIPVMAPRAAPLVVEEACVVMADRDRLLLVKRESGGLWGGFWEFPTVHIEGADPAGRSSGRPLSMEEEIQRLTGVKVERGPEIHSFKFAVTKHQVTMRVLQARVTGGEPSPGEGLEEVAWVGPDAMSHLTFGSAGRRVLAWLSQNPIETESP